jgi:hypothetical protein
MAAYKLSQRMFNPIGRCIYCGSDGEPEGLSREHIFPFSLGGTLTLPKSSCRKCASITQDFEQTCARTIFGNLRLLFDLPTRQKDQRPKELPLEIEVDGDIRTIMVPVADYPAVPIMFPIFDAPGILRGERPTNIFSNARCLPVLAHVPDNEARLKRLRERIGKPLKAKVEGHTAIGPFVRMLAKIAHSNAVAEFGLGSFKPLLPDIILGHSDHTPHFVGCIETIPAMLEPQFSDGTHRLFFSTSVVEFNIVEDGRLRVFQEEYLCAAIRLFKDMSSPTYLVVIGIPNPELTQQLKDAALPGGTIMSRSTPRDPRL